MSRILGLKVEDNYNFGYLPVSSIKGEEILTEENFFYPQRKFTFKNQISKIRNIIESLVQRKTNNYEYAVVIIHGIPTLVRLEAQLEEVYKKLNIPDGIYEGGWSGDTVTTIIDGKKIHLVTNYELKGWVDVEVTIKDGEGSFKKLKTDNFPH